MGADLNNSRKRTLFRVIAKNRVGQWVKARKFYIRRGNNKVDSIEIEHIVTVDLFPWSDLEKCMYATFFN